MARLLASIVVVLLLIPSLAFSESMDDLVKRGGLYYKKFTDVPFTGKLDEGVQRGAFKNGVRDGPWVGYHDNGQLGFRGAYKDGEPEGPWVEYHDNGQLFHKGEWKSGKREKPWVKYHYNGQLLYRGEYKNGEQEGPWVAYHDNGQLWFKGAFKNGKHEGPFVTYHKDGTKDEDRSGTFRDGVKVSD